MHAGRRWPASGWPKLHRCCHQRFVHGGAPRRRAPQPLAFCCTPPLSANALQICVSWARRVGFADASPARFQLVDQPWSPQQPDSGGMPHLFFIVAAVCRFLAARFCSQRQCVICSRGARNKFAERPAQDLQAPQVERAAQTFLLH